AATPTPYVYFMSIMLSSHRHLRNLHSFPTRRSSDLGDNSRSEQYKETKLEDLKRRMGNAVLAEMRNHVRNERSFDKSGRGVRGRRKGRSLRRSNHRFRSWQNRSAGMHFAIIKMNYALKKKHHDYERERNIEEFDRMMDGYEYE